MAKELKLDEKGETGCCPRFNPVPWDEKTLEWKDKLFVKDKVFTFMHIPMNFGTVITRLMKKIDNAGAKMPENICLSDHTSKWNMDIYVAVDQDVPGAENVRLSGKFLSKVYEGDFRDTGKWCEDFKQYADSKNLEIKKWYMWYTTCPKCAKAYGKNYTVIIGQV